MNLAIANYLNKSKTSIYQNAAFFCKEVILKITYKSNFFQILNILHKKSDTFSINFIYANKKLESHFELSVVRLFKDKKCC
jgi:hypothetical protein